jgi:hypothetical protein
MHQRDAAQEACGNVTGDVADYATANRQQERFAVGTSTRESAYHGFYRPQILRSFGVVEEVKIAGSISAQRSFHLFAGGFPDFWRGEDMHAGKVASIAKALDGPAEGPAATDYGVGSRRRLHPDSRGFHGSHRL